MIDEVIVLGSIQMRDGISRDDYDTLRRRMLDIVETIDGFQSVKRYTADDGETINIYRFASEDALDAWRMHPEHLETKKRGRAEFYSRLRLQICKVIREVNFQRQQSISPDEGDRLRDKDTLKAEI